MSDGTLPLRTSCERYQMEQDDEMPRNMGDFCRLPLEIRVMIWSLLLTTSGGPEVTYGKGSGIYPALLATNRTIHNEAVDFIYNAHHYLLIDSTTASKPWHLKRQTQNLIRPLPPYPAISRLRTLTLAITYTTQNRGECEEGLIYPFRLVSMTDPISLVLYRSKCLKSLTLLLLNTSQRKVGANHFKSHEMLQDMQRVLRSFAYLKTEVEMEIAGFRTLDYAEAFAVLRERYAGQEGLVDGLLEDAWRDCPDMDV